MASLVKPHQHENLPTCTSFRVAEVLPGQDGDPISCLLHVVNLSNPINYEAVSYAWGDVSLKATVTCDGKSLDVTRNLHRALSHLRLRDRPRFLWIDGIW